MTVGEEITGTLSQYLHWLL